MATRLNVLNVAYPLAPIGPDAVGGAEQVLTRLDLALVRAGHNSIVVACEGSQAAGVLVRIPRQKGVFDDRARAQAASDCGEAIQQVLKKWRIDIVHLHGFDFYQYLPPPGPPVLATLHLPPCWYPPRVFSIERPFTWVNCVSEAQERECPPCNFLLGHIDNGVPSELFHSRHSKRNLALALGRICPEKGFDVAIEAARKAEIPFFLGGEVFPYLEHERYFRYEVLPRLDRFRRFLGPVSLQRKKRLLAGARCLLAPSRAPETSSLVAIEALASGTPVIAFPSGALKNIVEDGVTGFLVNDLAQMADAIPRAARLDPRVCRQRAWACYSEELMVERYFELYSLMTNVAQGLHYAAAPIRPVPHFDPSPAAYPGMHR